MLGTTLVLIGTAGLAGKLWSMYMEKKDPPKEFEAKVAKTRLDTKKPDGREEYTYIITFYIYALSRYKSFEVKQKDFDIILEKDFGILTCNMKRSIFKSWRLSASHVTARI
jgi:hypothetical protein